MSRYLTPARVCLIVLVRIYQSRQTSSESSLDVLDFIARHVITPADQDDSEALEDNALLDSTISGFASKLQSWTSQIPGRSMYDVLVHALWEIHDLDAIDELLVTLRATVGRPGSEPVERRVTPASPLGQFIRRCHVEYTRLQFADVQNLWKVFVAYRAPTYDEWSSRNPLASVSFGENSVPYIPVGSSLVLDKNIIASTTDAEHLLGLAIQQLQKLGNRVPDAIKDQLRTWFEEQSEPGTRPLQYFMAFFDNWKAGQYTMALESLHQYFDYSLAARSGNDSLRVFYQYALLHLSVLHADFECWEESVDAMNECIATARENQDTACLNYALSWLLYLRHAHPGKESAFGSVSSVLGGSGNEQDEVRFLKLKAKESKNWVLMSSALLEEAKLDMCSGGNTARAQEHILQAAYLNHHHDQRNVSLATAIFRGASIERIGQSHLAARSYAIARLVHAEHSPLKDIVRSQCRVAQGLAQRGDFEKALDLLGDMLPRVKGVLKLEQRLLAVASLIQLKRSLHRDDRNAARFYLSQLRPLRTFSDPEIVQEINILDIEYHIRTNELDAAMTKVGKQLATAKQSDADVAQRLYFLVLKSRIYAASGHASKGFAIALRSAATAERSYLVPVLVESILSVARVLLDQSEFESSKALCESAMPKVLETSNTELVARTFVTLGEAYVGMCHSQPHSEQQKYLGIARDYIERGREAYEKIEDLAGMLDCLIMKARLARACSDESSAELADEMYDQLLADKPAT